MGQIPEYKSRQPLAQPEDSSLRAQAKLTQDIGQGISGLLGKGADIVFEARMAEEKMRKETYLNQAQADMQGSLLSLERHIEKEYSQNPDKGVEVWRARYKEITEGVGKAAPFPSAKKEFDFFSQTVGQRAEERVLSWKDKQVEANYIFSQDNLANNKITEIYRNPRDKQIYEETMMGLSDLANAFSVTQNPFLVNEKNRAYRKAAVQTRFKALFDEAGRFARTGDIAGANKVMDEVKGLIDSKDFDYDLGADGVSEITGNIKKFKAKAAKTARDFEHLKAVNPDRYFEKIGARLPTIDPKNLPNSIAAKYATLNTLNKAHGTNATLINKGDMAVMNRFLESSSPTQVVQAFRKMEGMDDELRQSYIGALAQENMPMAYLANSIALGEIDDDMAEEVLRGKELIKKDKATGVSGVVMPRPAEFQSGLDAILSSRITNPREKKAASMLVYQALAADRARRAETEVDFNEEDEDAMNTIVNKYFGTPMSWNGTEFLGPKDAPTDEVLNVLDSISDEGFRKAFGVPPVSASGNPIGIEKNRGDLKIQPTEIKGVFELYFKGQPLYFPKTKVPYRFNLNEYYYQQPEEIKKKSRGWFKRMFGN